MDVTPVRVAALLLVALLVPACSATVDGDGSGGTGASSSAADTGHDFPSASLSAPASGESAPATTGAASPRPTPSYRVVTVDRAGQPPIVVRVYAQDTISDCAAHAYGAPMLRFLRAHPCRGARRVLATTTLGNRTVVLSSIATGFTGTAADPYDAVARFRSLELADGTGSINDLLREGHPVPGVADHIPDHEVFQVIAQDDGATVFDAWYATGRTDDHDRALTGLERSLFLTSLTTG